MQLDKFASAHTKSFYQFWKHEKTNLFIYGVVDLSCLTNFHNFVFRIFLADQKSWFDDAQHSNLK